MAKIGLWLGLCYVVQPEDSGRINVVDEPGDNGSQTPGLLLHGSNEIKNETRVCVCVFDDINCLLEASFPIDAFNGGEIKTCGGLDNVHHFQQPPSWKSELLNQVMMPSGSILSTIHM